MWTRFEDRTEAGSLLAERLKSYADQPNTIVLSLAHGGVPVGFQIARILHLPLDVFIVRKIGVPGQPELAMGAIASGGVEVINRETVEALGIDDATFRQVAASEQLELERRQQTYRGGRTALDVHNRTVILVDDGLATGASMRSAVLALRLQHPRRIIVAVPVGAPSAWQLLRAVADEVICLHMPEPMHAIGLWYKDFSQTTDEEVRRMLQAALPQPDVAPTTSTEPGDSP